MARYEQLLVRDIQRRAREVREGWLHHKGQPRQGPPESPGDEDCVRCPGCGGKVLLPCRRCRIWRIRPPQPGVFGLPLAQVLGESRVLSILESGLNAVVVGDLLEIGYDRVAAMEGAGPLMQQEIGRAMNRLGFRWETKMS